MKIFSVRNGFSSAHSSVDYEFISESKIPSEAKRLAKQSGEQCTIISNIIRIHIPGERYLSDQLQETLLTKYDIPLLIYEDYEWLNFILMFDYDEDLFKNLKKYENENEHSISVEKLGGKIQLWCIVHVDYDAIISENPGVLNPFEPLRELFLEIRKRLIMKDFRSLEILDTYCSGEGLSEISAKDALEEKLKSYLDVEW